MAKQTDKKLADFLTLRLDPDLKSALERAAQEEERSIGQLVRLFIRESLSRRKERTDSPAKATRRKNRS